MNTATSGWWHIVLAMQPSHCTQQPRGTPSVSYTHLDVYKRQVVVIVVVVVVVAVVLVSSSSSSNCRPTGRLFHLKKGSHVI